MSSERSEILNLRDFIYKFLGKKLYELTLRGDYVPQTGADVIKMLEVPFCHRLVRVEVKHTDGSDVDSTAAFTWSLSRRTTKNLYSKIVGYSASVVTDFVEAFGETYEYPNMEYKLVTNTTNGHRIYLKMTIQLLD